MIKFGERLSVTIIAALTGIFYALLWALPSYRILLAVLSVIIFGALYFVVPRSGLRRFFWPLYIFNQIGFVGLFIILEWSAALLVVLILAVLSALAITLWSRRAPTPIVFVREKPLRRAVSLTITMALFSYVSFAHALLVFFPNPWLDWFIHPLVMIMAMIAAFLYWSLYFSPQDRGFVPPALLIGLIFWEASVVAHLTSFGYLVIGLFLAWLWYLAELLIRFHHDRRDIDWSHQLPFLVSNGILFIILAWLARYI